MRAIRKPSQLSSNAVLALAMALGLAYGTQAQNRPGAQVAQPQSSQPLPKANQASPQPSVGGSAARSVAFISVPYKDAPATEPKWVTGTCFFVEIPDDRIGKEKTFVYLVTNRHVADAEGAPPSSLLPEAYVRMNLLVPQNGKTVFDSKVMFTGPIHWYFPADDAVDLAVLPVGPDLKIVDMEMIPVSMLATDEIIKSRSVGLGDPIFFVGYFSQFPGIQHADPIYRSGVLAMMPADPIPMHSDLTDDTKKMDEHLWLADAHAFLGNSGSPLFINLGGIRNGGIVVGMSVYLLGVVNGFIPERNGTVTGAATFEEATRHDLPNSGVLTFVPAQNLRDLLYDPELQKLRDDLVAAHQNGH